MRPGRWVKKINGSFSMVLAAVVLATLALAGCVDTLPQPVAKVEKAEALSIAPRPGVSPSGASIAFVSLAGAPVSVRTQLGDAMTAEVARRSLKLAAADSADYLVRGNISAFSEGRSTQIAFVWDIYGADKVFRRRLKDSLELPTVAQNGWSLANAQVIAVIANRSTREIAAFLTHTPEAIAAAGNALPAATAQAAAGVKVSNAATTMGNAAGGNAAMGNAARANAAGTPAAGSRSMAYAPLQ